MSSIMRKRATSITAVMFLDRRVRRQIMRDQVRCCCLASKIETSLFYKTFYFLIFVFFLCVRLTAVTADLEHFKRETYGIRNLFV